MWYLGVLEKGIERHLSGYRGGEGDVEAALAEQMDAFGIVEEEIKQILLAWGVGFDPEAWDETGREALAREIRKRTKPIVVVANKLDAPAAQTNWDEITSEARYDHVDFVPVSAHAEKSLKKAAEAGVVDYTPGAGEFEIVGDVSEEQAVGLEQIREFVAEYGGTGVQETLETALFDTLGCVAVFPGSANGKKDEEGVFRDCFLLPGDSTAEDFAYHIHSDIGDGLLHGIDCRSKRQVGAGHELAHRDVVELVSTN